MKVLRREVGGMPLWAIALVIIATLVMAAFLSSASATRGKAPGYTPPSDASAPTIPAPMPLAVFIGDSYTQGAGGNGVKWPTLVGEARGWDVDNLGLGGTGYMKTSDVNGCGRTFCGAYSDVVDEIVGTPSYIFVAGGRNDLSLPLPDIAAAADALFGELRERYPQTKIFVISPWFDDDAPPTELGAAAAAIQAAALQNKVVYLDTGQPLQGRPDLISEDGVHPNADGYRALAAAVQTALDPALAP